MTMTMPLHNLPYAYAATITSAAAFVDTTEVDAADVADFAAGIDPAVGPDAAAVAAAIAASVAGASATTFATKVAVALMVPMMLLLLLPLAPLPLPL